MPAARSYSPECMEGFSLLKKSLSDQSIEQNGIRTLPQRGSNAAKAGRKEFSTGWVVLRDPLAESCIANVLRANDTR